MGNSPDAHPHIKIGNEDRQQADQQSLIGAPVNGDDQQYGGDWLHVHDKLKGRSTDDT